MAGALMGADELQAAYERAELVCDEAADAEQAAFARWQELLGAYEVARDESDRAWRAYSTAVPAAA